MSTVKKITKGRESFPMRHIKLQQVSDLLYIERATQTDH